MITVLAQVICASEYRRDKMTDNDMEIALHQLARQLNSKALREIADRFAELAKKEQ